MAILSDPEIQFFSNLFYKKSHDYKMFKNEIHCNIFSPNNERL